MEPASPKYAPLGDNLKPIDTSDSVMYTPEQFFDLIFNPTWEGSIPRAEVEKIIAAQKKQLKQDIEDWFDSRGELPYIEWQELWFIVGNITPANE